jgi:hypothetical protein
MLLEGDLEFNMTTLYANRHYAIFSSSEIPLIDFTQVMQTSAETLRFSINGEKTFVKWDGATPETVSKLTTHILYNHDEMMSVLSTAEWTDQDIINGT